MPVDTKKAPRRTVEYHTLADLSADLDRVQSAHDAGTLKTTGNWTAGQILKHCSILMKCAVDGFPPAKPPLHVWLVTRWIIRPIALRGEPPPPGIKLPPDAQFLLPPEGTTFEDGMSSLRTIVARVKDKGERFTVPSPVFGKLTHDQWTVLQLGHCRLHMSFIDLG